MTGGRAWAAGLFEGEGSIYINKTPGRLRKDGSRPVYYYPVLAVAMSDEDVIRKFHRIVGLGVVNGPYELREGNKPMWYWRAQGKQAYQVMKWMLPYLCSRRTNRWLEVSSG